MAYAKSKFYNEYVPGIFAIMVERAHSRALIFSDVLDRERHLSLLQRLVRFFRKII